MRQKAEKYNSSAVSQNRSGDHVTKRIVVLPMFLGLALSLFALPVSSPEENYVKAESLLLGNNVSLTDRSDALNLLQLAAEDGFAPAQTALGTVLETGALGAQDAQKAIDWYTKAANQGDWIAQLSLGRIYFRGFAVPRDASTARKWFLLAAASGDAVSAYYLGRLSDEGAGNPNYQEAAKWYLQAAEAGNPFAQERLGRLWLKGLVGSGSKQEAYVWLLVSVEFGNRHSSLTLQSMEGDIGKNGADAARRQALEIRDRILARRTSQCATWDGQYDDPPTPPPLQVQPACESLKADTSAN